MKIKLTGKVKVSYEFEVTFPDGTRTKKWSQVVEMGDLRSATLDVEQQADSDWKWRQEQAAANATAQAHWDWMQQQPNADTLIKAHFESQGLVESQEVAEHNIEVLAFDIAQDEAEELHYRGEDDNWHEEATKDFSTPLERARKIVESDIRWRLAKKNEPTK